MPHFQFSDKVAHFIVYTGLGFLFVRAFYPNVYQWSWFQVILVASLGCLVYGASDEFHQSFVPHRSMDIFDLLADVLGGFLGGILFLLERYAFKFKST